ncbi:MAG: tryptophan--tRNA ligase [Candidatus Omnitrophota bacterium]|jgi:tryptophanyl-tRNA synthetase|nr:tryptophan--tRNA ligase [Candidatus Omnitrophota bacterium]
MKKRILSGMRPTGKLHLGHLVGALDNWVKLQEEYDCFFMVADWHAFMSEYENTAELPENIIDNVVDWLSVGIDPDKSTVFIQSHIPEHAELHVIFSCITPLGLLERCPTYKEQMREVKARNLNTYGFLGYPVLQAADILLYKSDKVPVGQDQLPHLELTRQVARLFNNLSKKEIFPFPDAILTKTPKLLGLDGRKMSKSYLNTINLSDSPEVIMRKVSAMFTDPKRIKLSDKGHPDTCNVFSYYSVFMPQIKNEVYDWCLDAKKGCTECKKMLALAIIEKLAPIQEKRKSLLKDKAALKKILDEGAKKAAGVASGTMKEVRKAVNL